MKDNYICSLDLGSSKLAGIILCFRDKKHIKDIFFESLFTRCIEGSKIKDISALVVFLEQLLDSLKKKSNQKIRNVYLNISCEDLIMRHNFAIIPFAEKGNKLITLSDVRKVKEQALALGSCWEEEVIGSIPVNYTVDDKDGFINPVGLYAHKLGVDLLTFSITSAYFENLNHIINKLGYTLRHIFISGMGILEYIINKEELSQGIYMLLDIGAKLTDIIVYKDKFIKHIGYLAFGGDRLTESIGKELDISLDLAEELKINYATILEEGLGNKDVMIKQNDYYRSIPRSRLSYALNREVANFITSLQNYLHNYIGKEKIEKIFVCGRSALLEGLLEKMELELNTPVRMITYSDFSFLNDFPLNNIFSISQLLNYANCLKVFYEVEQLYKEINSSSIISPHGLSKRIINWFVELYQEYF
ncbi:MAG: hypothetical protein NC826_00400 [Candidatus Omnitrophica bacterium]|nr:hypothetical protein [Candidatus Omnitrophota bacterium]